MGSKPTLFLSHSSVDAEPIGRLKQLMVSTTGGTIEIFVSSDGQSIPFGRNWVHEIDEALRRAKVMFLFLSAAALRSRWIPFEAGIAYARGIRVVPVAIFGMDLAEVGPPLSLLQGFNLTSPPAMNNLLAIVNESFEFNFDQQWTAEQYEQVFVRGEARSTSLFEPFTHLIKGIKFQLLCEHLPESNAVRDFLQSLQLEPYSDGRKIYIPGLSLDLHKGTVYLHVDPLLSSLAFPVLDKVIPFLSTKNVESGITFELSLSDQTRAVEAIHSLSARVFGTEFELADNNTLCLGALSLRLRNRWQVSHVTPSPLRLGADIRHMADGVDIACNYNDPGNSLSSAPLSKALQILVHVGALYLDPT